jgi:DNA-binding Lrp family transcriptional regulator
MPDQGESNKSNSVHALDEQDLMVLSAIGAEPLGSYDRLSHLSGISVRSLSHRMATLFAKSILLRIGARVDYSAVGLQLTPVLASMRMDNVQKVEEACDLHPYTRYRIRCLGSTNGLFMLFAIPSGTEFQLKEFFADLRNLELVTDYRILHTTADPVYRNPGFDSYDLNSDTWAFKVERWSGQLDAPHEDGLKQLSESHLAKLDQSDLTLIRLLTENARRPQKTLARELNEPEYHVSRRLKFIFENHIVPGCDVFLGTKLYRFAPAALFEAICDPDFTTAVAAGVRSLPFQTSLFPTADGFVMMCGLPTHLFTGLGSHLLKRSEGVNVMWADYDSSMRYYFDESPYEEKTGRWKTDREFVIEETLSKLKEKMVKMSA